MTGEGSPVPAGEDEQESEERSGLAVRSLASAGMSRIDHGRNPSSNSKASQLEIARRVLPPLPSRSSSWLLWLLSYARTRNYLYTLRQTGHPTARPIFPQ